MLGTACAAPFAPDQLYREVTSAAPYQGLTREGFDKVVAFVATGGYALANYERYAKLKRTPEGLYRLAHPRHRATISAECRHHRRGADDPRPPRASEG